MTIKLYYPTYMALVEALTEWCLRSGIKEYDNPVVIKNKIYRHYIEKFGSFIAVNSLGDKQLFYTRQKKFRTGERKKFRNFMEHTERDDKEHYYPYAFGKHKRTIKKHFRNAKDI